MSVNYIDELNESQREAVLYNDGASLVIAGAGSGKTRVLTYKIAYLLENGYAPWSVLALTFTNKAAKEMKERIAQQVGLEQARRLWMGTFHAVFARILRAESAVIGFPPKFTIYDTSDSKSLLKDIIKNMGLDEKVYKPGVVQAVISDAKNRLVDPETYAASKENFLHDSNMKMPAIRDIYRHYWARCRQASSMDFDDLLFYTYLLFKEHPDVLAKYSRLFRYVLVDEYQDTNFAQHQIVLMLTQEHEHVCVVGDDAQSIYSFRGANIDNILRFTRCYHNTKVFKLEQNYRSTKNIVAAANSLIEKNREQIPKEVFSEKKEGEKIRVSVAYSDIEEGEIVAGKVNELRRGGRCSFGDIAVLYRTNAQSRVFEEAFRKRSFPYKIYGGLSFYQRKEIKDVVAYFRLVINPNDEEAFKRIINYPARGIGGTTVSKIADAAGLHGVSLWSVLCSPLEYGVNINKATHAKLQGFRALIEQFMVKAEEQNAYECGVEIVKLSGIMSDIYQDKSPENLSRQENVEELVNGMHDFCAGRDEEGDERTSLADFLGEISLLSDQDSEKEDGIEQITLMTVHSAKGLEFKHVFVVGLEENLFPSSMCMDSPRKLEEERRLFYVAITRAEEACYLSYARSRFRYGKMEFGSPSRFLRDIDAQYLSLPPELQTTSCYGSSASRAYSYRESSPQRPAKTVFGSALHDSSKSELVRQIPSSRLKKVSNSSLSSKQSAISIVGVCQGQYIEHERFGEGEVLCVEGTGENAKATVRFKHAGEKQLLLKFARFKVIK